MTCCFFFNKVKEMDGALVRRPRRRWKNNFKIYIKEIRGYCGTVSASRQENHGELLLTVNEPSGLLKFREFVTSQELSAS